MTAVPSYTIRRYLPFLAQWSLHLRRVSRAGAAHAQRTGVRQRTQARWGGSPQGQVELLLRHP